MRDENISSVSGAMQSSGAEMMLDAILQSASQGILTVDRSGRILSANPKTEEMFGYVSEELAGQAVEVLVPESFRAAHVRHRQAYHSNPHVRPMGRGYDLLGRRKDGTEFPVEISLSYVVTDAGLVAIAFVTDITERKVLEEQLLQSQKMDAVGRLAGGIAHDFNNLLTIISGYDRMMLDKLSPFDSVRGYAEEILKAADRATALTKQLLAFSRRQVVQPRVINVNDVLKEAEKMLRRLIGENIDLAVRPEPKLGNVKADAGQIEQVIFNLAANARDALPGGGRIMIETHNIDLDSDYARTHLGVEPGPYVMLAVSDNGKGMDAETKRRIFEPFFTTKGPAQGTGLGLATVYGIVKQNQGDIWVYSEIGRGSTFKIYLPRVPDAAENPQRAERPGEAERGTETVLVVEDEAGVRQLVVEVLRGQGYKVLMAGDGIEALQVAAQHDGAIHLLLTDVVMPHSSGRQLAERLNPTYPKMKVLYMSGYTENTVVHHGVLESDIAFLQKPFAFDTLLKKVREVLDKD